MGIKDERPLARAIVTLAFAVAGCGLLAPAAGAARVPDTVVACPTGTVPATLPTAYLGTSYSYQLVDGCGGDWHITSGTLPSGLSLSSSTGYITGTPHGTVATAALTVRATVGGHYDSFKTELPVADTIKVDSAGGELTGATNDGKLVYVAGSTAGKVFDLNTANPPTQHGVAMSGLNFPAAVDAFSVSGINGLLSTQFGEPAASGMPIEGALAPASVSNTPQPGTSIPNGDTTCSKPDGVSGFSADFYTEIAYSCAGSNQVTQTFVSFADTKKALPSGCQLVPKTPLEACTFMYSLGASGVPSGIAIDPSGNIWVADARNATVTEIGPFGSVMATVNLPAGSEPANVAYDSANHRLYVADPGISKVSQIKTNGTPSDVGEITLASSSRPFGVAVNKSGDTIVVTMSATNAADVIDVSHTTPAIKYTAGAGSTPDGVTIVGAEAFIADEQGGTVTVVDPPAPGASLTSMAVSHSRRGAVVHRARIRKARADMARVQRAAARHQSHLSLRKLLSDLRRTAHTTHPTKQAHTTAANVADPLVAPLPSVFR